MDPDPIRQFARWFDDARRAELLEPNAMTLATAAADGSPSARIVLLKAADERGFTFFTDYRSRKGRELEANPRAALVFYWGELERQVRMSGTVSRVSREENEAYFLSRPRGSRLGAWTSHQSTVDRDACRPGGAARGDDGPVRRRRRAAPAVLGRVPGAARHDRVLAGSGEPAARPDPLSARSRGVEGGAAVALSRPAGRGEAVMLRKRVRPL